MSISDIENEVDAFLNKKLDKRISASDYQDYAMKILNLMLTIYNKHQVRMTPEEAWTVLFERIV